MCGVHPMKRVYVQAWVMLQDAQYSLNVDVVRMSWPPGVPTALRSVGVQFGGLGGQWLLTVDTPALPTAVTVADGVAASFGKPIHVVVTVATRASDATVTLYIDGESVAHAKSSVPPPRNVAQVGLADWLFLRTRRQPVPKLQF